MPRSFFILFPSLSVFIISDRSLFVKLRFCLVGRPPLGVGVQPCQHLAAGLGEPDRAVAGQVREPLHELAEGLGAHLVDDRVLIRQLNPPEAGAGNAGEVVVQHLGVALASQPLAGQRRLGALDAGVVLFHVGAGVKRGVGVLVEVQPMNRLGDDLFQLAGVHPLGAVDSVGRALVRGVVGVGDGVLSDHLHLEHLSFNCI